MAAYGVRNATADRRPDRDLVERTEPGEQDPSAAHASRAGRRCGEPGADTGGQEARGGEPVARGVELVEEGRRALQRQQRRAQPERLGRAQHAHVRQYAEQAREGKQDHDGLATEARPGPQPGHEGRAQQRDRDIGHEEERVARGVPTRARAQEAEIGRRDRRRRGRWRYHIGHHHQDGAGEPAHEQNDDLSAHQAVFGRAMVDGGHAFGFSFMRDSTVT